jgi:lipopolysaccharide/colanic/teichoic acid biosynthesis glycosyltransferase
MNRTFDLVAAVSILVLVLPVVAFAALAIIYESPGPIFAKQPCIGLGGRRFELLTFRTAALPLLKGNWARYTVVGEFLRYTRIETLPQLINVLRRDITLREVIARLYLTA